MSSDTSHTRARKAVVRLREHRDEALAELSQVSEAECRYPAQWATVTRTVNFLLRTFAHHEIDHLQHAQRLLRARGRDLSEAQLILMKAHALRGELEALLLSVSDEEWEAGGPNEGDWSMAQLVNHLRGVDEAYLGNVRKALAEHATAAGS